MEVSQLSRDLKYVEANGVTLSIDERMRLDLATQVLVSELPDYASSIQLWGKIRGKDHNLMIDSKPSYQLSAI